jgi:hypothetical protein
MPARTPALLHRSTLVTRVGCGRDCLVDDQARHANTGARQNIGDRIARPGFARAWA